MGLLERALKYKKNLNSEGKETLIDKIKGPAESKIGITKTEKIDFDKLDNIELEYVQISSEEKGESILHLSDEDITEVTLDDEKISKVEEEIVFLDESTISSPDKNEKLNADELKQVSNDFDIEEYNDYQVLFEIFKDLVKCSKYEELYEVFSFSLMGQMAVSSVSILISDESDNIKIAHSTGVNVTDPVLWDMKSGIFKQTSFSKEIVDLDVFKDNKDFREDYYRFISIDGRLLAPVFLSNKIYGAVVIGEKIDNSLYSDMDYIFLRHLAQIFSISLDKIQKSNKTYAKFEFESNEREVFDDVESFQDNLINVKSRKDFTAYIRQAFLELGIEIFTIYSYAPALDQYIPELYEEDNVLDIVNGEPSINMGNHLIRLLQAKKTPIVIDNYSESEVLIDIYGYDRISKMNDYLVYPFVFSGEIPGFIVINKVHSEVSIDDIDIRMRKIIKFIFPYFNEFHLIEKRIINSEIISYDEYKLMDRRLSDCIKVDAPFSIVKLFFTNTGICKKDVGVETVFKWLKSAEKSISEKISGNDLFLKIGLDRYLLVLPGKDKKYISNMSAVLKKSIFETTELNLSYIAVTMGEDGEDVFDLIDQLN